MNWIFLNPIKGNDWGGMENWMVKLCRELPRHGDRCLIGARPLSRWPDQCTREGIPFAPFAFGFDLAPWAVARLRRIGRGFKPDIVIVKGFRAARFARIAWPSAAIGVKLPSADELQDGPIERCTYHTCIDRILTDNHVARAGFLQHPWVLPGKIAVAHNGVALPAPGAGAALRASLRQAFNLATDTLIIGAAGRMEPNKNYDHAIEAIARLPRDIAVHLLLLGDGPAKPALVAQAEKLGVSDRVLFAGWRDNARELLWGCDGVLHPSKIEGLPNVVLESMAGGIPVVATNAGGTSEIITDRRVGRVIPVGDIAAMSSALLELIQDGSLRLEIGREAARHIREHFSIERMAGTIRAAMTEAWHARQDRQMPSSPASSGQFWLRSSASALGSHSLAWDQLPGAELVSRSEHAIVHRIQNDDGTFYVKRFPGRRFSLRALGLRRPIASDNFRTAARLTLRGAAAVPHVAAGWSLDACGKDESVLITGTIQNAVTLDQWLQSKDASLTGPRVLARELASWLAHLHGAGVACHDLRASNVLVRVQDNGHLELTLLDLDNCQLRSFQCTDHDTQRNLHQFFRSFQAIATPPTILRFLSVYRRVRGLDRRILRRLIIGVERRLHRRGTGYAEILAAYRGASVT